MSYQSLTRPPATDPHPGNLIRTPDGRLAILDFGLMTKVDDNIKYGMIEAISHLIHRDYEAIVEDFVTLEFIPKGTDLRCARPARLLHRQQCWGTFGSIFGAAIQ